jgi:hypothetical protein
MRIGEFARNPRCEQKDFASTYLIYGRTCNHSSPWFRLDHKGMRVKIMITKSPTGRATDVMIQFRWEGVSGRDVFAIEAKQSQREKEEIAIPRPAGLRSSQ